MAFKIERAASYLVFLVTTFMMASVVARYASFNPHAEFLQFKQAALQIEVWRYAFYTHVFSSLLILVAGGLQFSRLLLVRQRRLHRSLGMIYVVGILLINAPAALVLATHASGGLVAQVAFVALAILWFYFTLKAFLSAKKRDIDLHKQFMIRSYALTFSAVTFRLWTAVLSDVVRVDQWSLYQIVAWLGFLPNLVVAEWLVRKRVLSFGGLV
jgi:hypothetical protein